MTLLAAATISIVVVGALVWALEGSGSAPYVVIGGLVGAFPVLHFVSPRRFFVIVEDAESKSRLMASFESMLKTKGYHLEKLESAHSTRTYATKQPEWMRWSENRFYICEQECRISVTGPGFTITYLHSLAKKFSA